MTKESKRESTEPKGVRLTWSWISLVMLGLATLLFLSHTIFAFKEQQEVAKDLDKVVKSRKALEKRSTHLKNQIHSICNDPQKARTFLDEHKDDMDLPEKASR